MSQGGDEGRLSIAVTGQKTASGLSQIVADGLGDTLRLETILPERFAEVRCGARIGAWLNAMVRRSPGPRALFVDLRDACLLESAAWANKGHFVIAGGAPAAAIHPDANATGDGATMHLRSGDLRDAGLADLGPFDLYCHDAPRGRDDRMFGLFAALPALAREFVTIVEDWNVSAVRQAHRRAIRATNMRCLYAVEIFTRRDGAADDGDCPSNWRNGCQVGVYAQPPIANGT